MSNNTENKSTVHSAADVLPAKKSVRLIHGVFDEAGIDRILGRGKPEHFFVLEGRPNLDSGRSTCALLLRKGITPTVIADNMAGYLFYQGLVKDVCFAAGTISEDGVIAQIGSLILAVLARKHKINVHVYPGFLDEALVGKTKDLLMFNGQPVTTKRTKGFVPLAEWVSAQYITKVHS